MHFNSSNCISVAPDRACVHKKKNIYIYVYIYLEGFGVVSCWGESLVK